MTRVAHFKQGPTLAGGTSMGNRDFIIVDGALERSRWRDRCCQREGQTSPRGHPVCPYGITVHSSQEIVAMARFLVMLVPDVEDGGYTVTIPGLPGLVTDGQTVDEAMERAGEAIELYFEGEDAESLTAAGFRSDCILASLDIPVHS